MTSGATPYGMYPMPTSEPTQPYWKRLRSLLDERNMTLDDLFLSIRGSLSRSALGGYTMEPRNPPPGKRPRWRYPSIEALEQIAQGLDVDPNVFPEYRLAKARRALDEREPAGFDGALEALAIFEEGQRLHVERHFGPSPTDRLQRERDALDFEQELEDEDRLRHEASQSTDEDEQSEDGQEKRP